jgi:hypothetical protein
VTAAQEKSHEKTTPKSRLCKRDGGGSDMTAAIYQFAKQQERPSSFVRVAVLIVTATAMRQR